LQLFVKSLACQDKIDKWFDILTDQSAQASSVALLGDQSHAFTAELPL
jgi:hypothetical protein